MNETEAAMADKSSNITLGDKPKDLDLLDAGIKQLLAGKPTEFPSDLKIIEKILDAAEEKLIRDGWSGNQVHYLGLAITEGITNAIRHGNKEGDLDKQTDKKIKIILITDQEGFDLAIEDEGKGFDVNKISDPLTPENLLKPNGRGIFYLRKFLGDRVRWENEGRRFVVAVEKNSFNPPSVDD